MALLNVDLLIHNINDNKYFCIWITLLFSNERQQFRIEVDFL